MEATLERKVIKIAANPLLAEGNKTSKFKRVAAYCRVSTDEEEQLNSFNAQVAYYTEAIAKNPSWHFSGVYADEGISGTGTKNRKEFMRLMRDCEKGKIDMILTKSISRFARNTVDSLTWVRKLRTMGVGVYFEEQAIDSLKTESEMLIGLFSVIAQSESENISSNVRWGIKQSMKNGEFCSNFSCFGYKRGEDGIPTIVPEEAEIIKMIFQKYIDGASVNQIADYLNAHYEKTYGTSEKWARCNIRRVLSNEKYVGDLLLQKTFTSDPISKKTKKNNGELPKYLIKNNHPAIIERSTFELAQLEMSRRSNMKKKSQKSITELGKYSGKFVLSEILFCACCGSHYRRRGINRKGKKIYYWRCIGKIEGRCNKSVGIEETKLHSTICRCLSKMFQCNEETKNLCMSNLKYAVSGDDKALDAAGLEDQIKVYYEKIDFLMERSEKTDGNAERYESEIIRMYDEISVLREQLDLANKQANSKDKVQSEVERFLQLLDDYSPNSFQTFDDTTVRRLVECIEISADHKIKLTLKGGVSREELIY